MNSKIKFQHRKPHLNSKVVIDAKKNMCIEVDHVFVMVRTATLNWEISIGVLELGVIFKCLSNF
jgi:hypothetical protein